MLPGKTSLATAGDLIETCDEIFWKTHQTDVVPQVGPLAGKRTKAGLAVPYQWFV